MSSEKLHEKLEQGHDKLDLHETSKQNLERIQKEAEVTEHDHSLDRIHESIHKEAISAKEFTVGETGEDGDQPILGVQKELKATSYQRTLKRVRASLNAADRAFSKIIHHSAIEPISEISSKTLARPSGILGGGIAALVGSGIVLYMARRYGFQYNFTTFLILLVAGFISGIAIEVLIRLLRRGRT